MRPYKIILRIFLLLIIVAAAGIGWLVTSLSWTSGETTVAGIAKPVDILRDDNGVPHIAAENDDDSYFALGVAHAQDRFWQMEMMRRFGAGRLAEVFGPDLVDRDKWMRTLGLYRLAEKMVEDAAPPVRSALQAYARGVNHWRQADIGLLAPEFALFPYTPEPWKPADSLVWGKIMAARLGGNWRGEVLRAKLAKSMLPAKVRELWPAYPSDGPTTVASSDGPTTVASDVSGTHGTSGFGDVVAGLDTLPPWPLGWPKGASNAWAVAGSTAEAGGAILANDPHLAFTAPILWYLARVETPEWTAMGATVPGVPFFILGQTGSHAWGMTSTQSDIEDLFIEKIDTNEPGRYRTPNGSEAFRVRKEVIKVKGAADVALSVRTTRHGPVISDLRPRIAGLVDDTHLVALSATYLKPGDRTSDAFYDLVRATDWPAFRAALRLFRAPQQNFFFADTDGEVGFITAGRVPIRGKGQGYVPTNGWTGETDWTGFLPLIELPQVAGIPFVFNANNRVAGSDYEHFLGHDWAPPHRADRIRSLLDDGLGRTAKGAQTMQRDLFSNMARDLLPLMIKTKTQSARAGRALALLRNWDGVMAGERSEPLIFSAWLLALNKALYGDELADNLPAFLGSRPLAVKSLLTRRQGWCDNVTTTPVETCDEQLSGSLESAITDLAATQGSDVAAWRWDALHVAHFPHPVFTRVPLLNHLADLRVPTGGGNATINRGAMRFSDSLTPFKHVHGAGYRAVYDLKDPSASRFIIATGQSGNPLSPKYRNFLEHWGAGGYISLGQPLRVLREEAQSRMRLTPVTAKPK